MNFSVYITVVYALFTHSICIHFIKTVNTTTARLPEVVIYSYIVRSKTGAAHVSAIVF